MKTRYDCSKCPGFCCSYPRIPVKKTDLEYLAVHFEMKKSEAKKRFTKKDSVNKKNGKPSRMTRVVRATAYNATEVQTDSTPLICAWGDRIRPGIIAVSRDLEKLGLTRGRTVYVEGYGKRIVLDRMHARKRNQIDLYMDTYEEAINFGVQELVIHWEGDV